MCFLTCTEDDPIAPPRRRINSGNSGSAQALPLKGRSRNDAALDGKLHETGARPYAQVLHDLIFVKSHGARSYSQQIRGLLHGLSFSQELDDLALA